MSYQNFLLTLLNSIYLKGFDAKTFCDDDWLPYQDEKCVKLFETFTNRDQAELFCNQNGATLVVINSAAEQKLLTELVFNSSYSNNAWIGAKRRLGSETEFDWNDGSPVEVYTNWAVGRPSIEVRKPCVQMQSELSRKLSDMKWADSGCTTGDWFICQKLQPWPFEHLQKAILGIRRQMEYNVNSLTNQMTDMTTKLNIANTQLKYLHENPSKFYKV